MLLKNIQQPQQEDNKINEEQQKPKRIQDIITPEGNDIYKQKFNIFGLVLSIYTVFLQKCSHLLLQSIPFVEAPWFSNIISLILEIKLK